MRAVQFDSKFTDQLERELIRREMNAFPPRFRRTAQAGATPWDSGRIRYSKAVMVLKGTLIVIAVVFVIITLVLRGAARFS
jgi:hypothetical protein